MRPTLVWSVCFLVLLLLGFSNGNEVECRYDASIPHVPRKVPLAKRSFISNPRLKEGPEDDTKGHSTFGKRSISRCRGLVESISVPDDATTYHGIPIGGVVSIIESTSPWNESDEGEMTPICSGIFIDKAKVLSSAHCVYHQRRDASGARFWLFGDDSVRRRYFYAVTGKTSAEDETINVYPLQSACIPKSYVSADNETVTSGQMNDMVIFTTLTPFSGDDNALAELMHALPSGNEVREYILPQYPLDVASGAQLVVDVSTSPLYKTTYFGGTFYSIDLVSWIGSSGGAILDVTESMERGRPVLAGILMSEGWQVCDSGILPLQSSNWLFWQCVTSPPKRPIEDVTIPHEETMKEDVEKPSFSSISLPNEAMSDTDNEDQNNDVIATPEASPALNETSET